MMALFVSLNCVFQSFFTCISVWTLGIFLYCEGDWALVQVARRGCVVSFPVNIQKPSGHVPGLLALGDPAWAERWTRWCLEIPSNLDYSVIIQSFIKVVQANWPRKEWKSKVVTVDCYPACPGKCQEKLWSQRKPKLQTRKYSCRSSSLLFKNTIK